MFTAACCDSEANCGNGHQIWKATNPSGWTKLISLRQATTDALLGTLTDTSGATVMCLMQSGTITDNLEIDVGCDAAADKNLFRISDFNWVESVNVFEYRNTPGGTYSTTQGDRKCLTATGNVVSFPTCAGASGAQHIFFNDSVVSATVPYANHLTGIGRLRIGDKCLQGRNQWGEAGGTADLTPALLFADCLAGNDYTYYWKPGGQPQTGRHGKCKAA